MRLATIARPLQVASILAALAGGESATAALVVESTFNPSGAVDLCGLAFDPAAGAIWVYGCFGADAQAYSSAGVLLDTNPRVGESTNDVDLEMSPARLTLGSTVVPPGTLFFINGETGRADIYAIDTAAGAVVATLQPLFGDSHVVGGAFHPGRNTFYLLQDSVAGATNGNRVAEINPATAEVVNTFQIPGFSVSYGDLEVCASTGSLFVVSSIQNAIAEYSPIGLFYTFHPLPAGVTSLSGIGLDDLTGKAWVSSTDGNVWRLSGLPCPPCAPALAVATSGGQTQVSWPNVAGIPVDVVKGHLPTLRTTGGDFTAALDAIVPSAGVCLDDDDMDGMVVYTGTNPASKAAWFYLGRCQGGSYDSLTASQVASRDAEIAAAVGACP